MRVIAPGIACPSHLLLDIGIRNIITISHHRHHHHRHDSHESSYTSPQRPLKHRHQRSHESSDRSQHRYSHAKPGGYSSHHYNSHRDNTKGRSTHKIDQGTLNITKPCTKGKELDLR